MARSAWLSEVECTQFPVYQAHVQLLVVAFLGFHVYSCTPTFILLAVKIPLNSVEHIVVFLLTGKFGKICLRRCQCTFAFQYSTNQFLPLGEKLLNMHIAGFLLFLIVLNSFEPFSFFGSMIL